VRTLVRGLGSVVVAFSGGVDSSVVLALAVSELGAHRVLAVTATSETYPHEERALAHQIASVLGVRHRLVAGNELQIEGFSQNPPDRCFYCKHELFEKLGEIARSEGFAAVCDGANRDDQGDFRPGIRAADELGVRHPLLEAGLGKDAVRALARSLGLPNWERPAMACLSSRFPYGEPITGEKLVRVGEAERYLRRLGLEGLRVRHHGPLARIEVPAHEIARLAEPPTREAVVAELKRLGFTYVTLDLEGFRSGSMNEVLRADQEQA